MNREIKKYSYTVSWKEQECDICKGAGIVEIAEEKMKCGICDGTGKLTVPDEQTEFTFKKVNLRFRALNAGFTKTILKFIRPFTEESSIKIKESVIDSPEHKYWTDQYNLNSTLAVQEYIVDEDRLKDLFNRCLDGDLTKINYEADTDESYQSLILLGGTVLNDFFSINSLPRNR